MYFNDKFLNLLKLKRIFASVSIAEYFHYILHDEHPGKRIKIIISESWKLHGESLLHNEKG